MAKLERTLHGSFDEAVRYFDSGVLQGSSSASLEECSSYQIGSVRCSIRVYERYSYTGGNRVSMTVTIIGDGSTLFLSGITSGGSQAVFFKINTWGEESFLDTLRELADAWPQ